MSKYHNYHRSSRSDCAQPTRVYAWGSILVRTSRFFPRALRCTVASTFIIPYNSQHTCSTSISNPKNTGIKIVWNEMAIFSISPAWLRHPVVLWTCVNFQLSNHSDCLVNGRIFFAAMFHARLYGLPGSICCVCANKPHGNKIVTRVSVYHASKQNDILHACVEWIELLSLESVILRFSWYKFFPFTCVLIIELYVLSSVDWKLLPMVTKKLAQHRFHWLFPLNNTYSHWINFTTVSSKSWWCSLIVNYCPA